MAIELLKQSMVRGHVVAGLIALIMCGCTTGKHAQGECKSDDRSADEDRLPPAISRTDIHRLPARLSVNELFALFGKGLFGEVNAVLYRDAEDCDMAYVFSWDAEGRVLMAFHGPLDVNRKQYTDADFVVVWPAERAGRRVSEFAE